MTTPARILAVDDTPTNLVLLRGVLEKAGFDVLTATDGFEAVEIAGSGHPDLVLLDVMAARKEVTPARVAEGKATQTRVIKMLHAWCESNSKEDPGA